MDGEAKGENAGHPATFMTHEPPAKCGDETTWNHKDEQIDLPTLISLVEAHGGTEGLDLHGCKLTGVDLSYAALQPYVVHRPGTNTLPPWIYGVWGVKLQGAHLEHAEIITSVLRGADLSFAHLERTAFVSCVLDEAAIVRASAQRMMILFGSANKTIFNNSDLRNATLGANLTGASFGGTNMRDATLLDATLDAVDLRLTDLTGAMLYGAKFNKTRIRPSNLGWAIGEELVARGKKLHHRRVTYVEAADVYRDLKANLVSLGYYDEASWAYVKQKQMEKMAYRGYWRRNWPLTWLSFHAEETKASAMATSVGNEPQRSGCPPKVDR